MKMIKLMDNGIEKTFELHKFKALEHVKFNHKFLSALDGLDFLDVVTIANAKQLVANVMVTGEKIEGSNMSKLDGSLLHMLFNIVKHVLAGATDKKQDEIYEAIFSKIVFVNGGVIKNNMSIFSNDPNSDVNNIISDFTNVYKLCWEFIKYNYEDIFKRFLGQAETTNSAEM